MFCLRQSSIMTFRGKKNVINYALLASILLITACQNPQVSNTETINIGSSEEDTVELTARQLNVTDNYMFSFYSFLQANTSGLYITPANAIRDSILFEISAKDSKSYNSLSHILNGVIRKGSGPKELLDINLSTKSATGDTLFFYSANSAAFISIDNEGTVLGRKSAPKNVFTNGSAIGINKGYFLFPVFNPIVSKDNLLAIVEKDDGSMKYFFRPRVPAGYEPAIRNMVFPIGAVPNGFAFSFLGDRQIFITNFKGDILKTIILGESDPIPDPYIIDDPSGSPGATPYITKIEFFEDHLFILMENQIYIIAYPDLVLSKILRIKRKGESDLASVVDFSVNSEKIFLRIGREGLFTVDLNNNWLNELYR